MRDRDRLTPADLRERVGLTQQELAEAMGKAVSTLASWEQFRKQPRLTFTETLLLCKLLKVFKSTLAIVYDRADPNNL